MFFLPFLPLILDAMAFGFWALSRHPWPKWLSSFVAFGAVFSGTFYVLGLICLASFGQQRASSNVWSFEITPAQKVFFLITLGSALLSIITFLVAFVGAATMQVRADKKI